MDARDRIIDILNQRKEEGVLQSELPKLVNLSKSTVSEILSSLEAEGVVVRNKVTRKSYRIWLLEHYPNPLENKLRVGILKASEYPAVVIAAKKLNGVVKVFDNSLELTRALSIGSVDLAASPLITQVLFASLMKNIMVFRVVALNGSGIVMRKSDCKKIGTTELSTMELNLKKVNKNWNFVYFKSPERMIESLRDGEVDGIAIWEPYLTELSGEYEVVKFSEIIGDYPCCSLAANLKFVEKNENLFNQFLQEFDIQSKKVDLDNNDTVKAAKELSNYIGFNEKLIKESFSSFIFNHSLTNEEILEFVEKEVLLRRESIKPLLRLDYLPSLSNSKS